MPCPARHCTAHSTRHSLHQASSSHPHLLPMVLIKGVAHDGATRRGSLEPRRRRGACTRLAGDALTAADVRWTRCSSGIFGCCSPCRRPGSASSGSGARFGEALRTPDLASCGCRRRPAVRSEAWQCAGARWGRGHAIVRSRAAAFCCQARPGHGRWGADTYRGAAHVGRSAAMETPRQASVARSAGVDACIGSHPGWISG